jgi:hypothetical protein
LVLAAAALPDTSSATDSEVIRWFSDAAAPALQTAAPTNDPVLAARELLNRGLAKAATHLPQAAPPWLARVRVDLSFDPAFQPRYAVAATQPVVASAQHDAAIDLHGRVVYDASGNAGGDLGLRYRGRWHGHDVLLGVQGGVEDRWLEERQRFSFGSELGLGGLEVRASLHDDVLAHPATRDIAERRLDGYEVAASARLPFLPWARLRASRFWQTAVDGDAATTCHRLTLGLIPLAALEVETGVQSEGEARSWFTQLRWRMTLGE